VIGAVPSRSAIGANFSTVGIESIRVSSGRHTGASEHRAHFGESTSGGGIGPFAQTRASAILEMTHASSSGVSSSGTRCFVFR
jgi:hypothetical protein